MEQLSRILNRQWVRPGERKEVWELGLEALLDFGDAGINLGNLFAGTLVGAAAPVGRKGQCGAELLVRDLPSALKILPLTHKGGQRCAARAEPRGHLRQSARGFCLHCPLRSAEAFGAQRGTLACDFFIHAPSRADMVEKIAAVAPDLAAIVGARRRRFVGAMFDQDRLARRMDPRLSAGRRSKY